jgi:glycosyltransferase involved in cell wall biosynthesis
MNKSILYIWDSDYPWDVRVEKICQSLLQHGYDVHIAARNLKALPVYEQLNGLHIHRLKSFSNRKINYALSFPVFFSPIWKRFLDAVIAQNKIDLLIVRDLPMAVAAVWAGQRHKIPVVFDMAEDYVAMLRNIWKFKKFNVINLLVRNPYLATLVERYALKRVNHVLIVIEEAERVVVRGGGKPEQVTVVGNTPPFSAFRTDDIQMTADLRLIKKRYSAIYTGGLQLGRGIQTVLEAIPEVVKQIPDFLFVVVGDGYAAEQLKNMSRKNKLDDYVLWTGWVNHARIFDYIRLSKLGVIPHLVTDHVNTTIPNKIFDYMGCGIPVIASDSAPMKRILDEEQCGLVFRSGDVCDLMNKILRIHSSSNDFGKNGQEAVKIKYSWAEDEKRLVNVVEKSILDA